MSAVDIDEVIKAILADAKDKRAAAGFDGSLHDNGASALEEQVMFYEFGRKNVLPPTWEAYVPKPKFPINKKHPIQFEYCECGCKCYSAQSKGVSYSIYWNLEKKAKGFAVSRGHNLWGKPLGKFDSYEEAVKVAQDDYDKIP